MQANEVWVGAGVEVRVKEVTKTKVVYHYMNGRQEEAMMSRKQFEAYFSKVGE